MTSRAGMMQLIRQVHLRFVKYFSRKFATSRLSHPQYMLMMCLLEEGAQKMNLLAELLHISTPAVTNLVDKLEKSGYAKRVPHPTDRRAHVIELTPFGRKFINGLRTESLQLMEETIGTLPVSDQKVIERFYGNLLARLDDALRENGRRNPKFLPVRQAGKIPNPR